MAMSKTVQSVKELGVLSAIIVGVAIIVVIGIAVLNQFKTTALVSNTTIDLFTAGLTLVGTFMQIIVLGIIGKTLIGMFKGGA